MNGQTTLFYCAMVTLATAGVTLLLRAFPFLAFGRGGKPAPVVTYIGEKLAPAAIAMLSIYCLAAEALDRCHRWGGQMWPEATASLVVIVLQYCFKKPLLSIVVGTILYMVLIQHLA